MQRRNLSIWVRGQQEPDNAGPQNERKQKPPREDHLSSGPKEEEEECLSGDSSPLNDLITSPPPMSSRTPQDQSFADDSSSKRKTSPDAQPKECTEPTHKKINTERGVLTSSCEKLILIYSDEEIAHTSSKKVQALLKRIGKEKAFVQE